MMPSQFFCVGDNKARLDLFPIFGDIHVLLSLITSVKVFTNISYLIQMSFLGHNFRVNRLNQRINLNNRIRAIRADLPELSLTVHAYICASTCVCLCGCARGNVCLCASVCVCPCVHMRARLRVSARACVRAHVCS